MEILGTYILKKYYMELKRNKYTSYNISVVSMPSPSFLQHTITY